MYDADTATAHGSSLQEDLRRTPPLPLGEPSKLATVARLAQEVRARLGLAEARPLPRGPCQQELEAICLALIRDGDGEAEAEALLTSLSAEEHTGDRRAVCLAGAARMLGDWWREDRVSFVEVTVGAARILEMLRPSDDQPRPDGAHPLPIIFASVPGEQHVLGVRMATNAFRAEGWDVALRIGRSEDELVTEIEQLPKCIVGLSIGGPHSIGALSQLALSIHRNCPNAVLVASGNDIDHLRPQLSSMKLDGIADGLDEARLKMSSLWSREAPTRR